MGAFHVLSSLICHLPFLIKYTVVVTFGLFSDLSLCLMVFVLQVLQDFHLTSRRVPFEYLFDLIPPMQPRAFSIASSPQVSSA